MAEGEQRARGEVHLALGEAEGAGHVGEVEPAPAGQRQQATDRLARAQGGERVGAREAEGGQREVGNRGSGDHGYCGLLEPQLHHGPRVDHPGLIDDQIGVTAHHRVLADQPRWGHQGLGGEHRGPADTVGQRRTGGEGAPGQLHGQCRANVGTHDGTTAARQVAATGPGAGGARRKEAVGRVAHPAIVQAQPRLSLTERRLRHQPTADQVSARCGGPPFRPRGQGQRQHQHQHHAEEPEGEQKRHPGLPAAPGRRDSDGL